MVASNCSKSPPANVRSGESQERFGKLIEKLMLQNSRLWARSTSGMSNYNDGLMAQYKNTVIWRY